MPDRVELKISFSRLEKEALGKQILFKITISRILLTRHMQREPKHEVAPS